MPMMPMNFPCAGKMASESSQQDRENVILSRTPGQKPIAKPSSSKKFLPRHPITRFLPNAISSSPAFFQKPTRCPRPALTKLRALRAGSGLCNESPRPQGAQQPRRSVVLFYGRAATIASPPYQPSPQYEDRAVKSLLPRSTARRPQSPITFWDKGCPSLPPSLEGSSKIKRNCQPASFH